MHSKYAKANGGPLIRVWEYENSHCKNMRLRHRERGLSQETDCLVQIELGLGQVRVSILEQPAASSQHPETEILAPAERTPLIKSNLLFAIDLELISPDAQTLGAGGGPLKMWIMGSGNGNLLPGIQ